jgi:hypothetical protein
MVVVKVRRGIFVQTDVYYPSLEELKIMMDDLSPRDLLCIHQTRSELPIVTPVTNHMPFLTSFIDLTMSPEALLAAMDAKSCRYEIRKAEKLGGRIEVRSNNSAVYSDFFDLYNRFVLRNKHTRPMSLRRFEAYVSASDVFIAYFDSSPVCGHLMIRDDTNGRAGLVFSATVRRENQTLSIGPLNRFLHWHEIKEYKTRGFGIYDFGGIGEMAPSVASFKSSFGGRPILENSYLVAGGLSRMAMTALNKVRELTPVNGVG